MSDDAVSSLSDEFNSASTLSSWTIDNGDLASTIDINKTLAGHLVIIPRGVFHNAWYSDFQAPYLYKTVSGNFVAEISVRVASTGSSNPSVAPLGQFNSAGFVVRDPASPGRTGSSPAASPSGGQRWFMYNLGFQVNNVSREAKSTVANTSGASLSTLYLNATPGGVNSALLRVCRLGSTFHMYHMHSSETAWTEERLTSSTQRMGNGSFAPTPGVSDVVRFVRTDLPNTLQVGIIGNAWGAPYQTEAEYDYIHFGKAAVAGDCTAPITSQL